MMWLYLALRGGEARLALRPSAGLSLGTLSLDAITVRQGSTNRRVSRVE
ncbi:MAG: hypothetical protein RXQ00_07140 [Caldivirga sp.]